MGGWYLYIIETEGGRLYTGITTDPVRRLREHASGRGARFFRTDPPRAVRYLEPHQDRSSASRREFRIKRMKKQEKEALIAGFVDLPQEAERITLADLKVLSVQEEA